MTFTEALHLAEKAQPELMQKTANAVRALEKLAPEMVPGVLDEFRQIGAIFEEKSKTASIAGEVGKTILTTVAAGAGLALATDLWNAAKKGLSKGSNWKRIMQANPNLREEVAHPERLPSAYDTLHRFAPEVSADPVVSGAVLRILADTPPQTHLDHLKRLVDVHKTIADGRARPFQTIYKVDPKTEQRTREFEPRTPRKTALPTNHPRTA